MTHFSMSRVELAVVWRISGINEIHLLLGLVNVGIIMSECV